MRSENGDGKWQISIQVGAQPRSAHDGSHLFLKFVTGWFEELRALTESGG